MRKSLIALLIAGLWPLCALAQTSPLILDRDRTDRRPPTAPQAQAAPAVPTAAAALPPVVLKDIRIDGASLDPALLKGALQPFLGRRADTALIQEIAQTVNDLYAAASPIAFFAVSAPPQSLDGGVLHLSVAEGYIARVDVHGDIPPDIGLLQAYAAKLASERPLRKATWQRNAMLIRDIPGLTAQMTLEHGEGEGAMVLSLDLSRRAVQFALDITSRGARKLGRTQWTAAASFFQLFQQGDRLQAAFAAPTSLGGFQFYTLSLLEPIGGSGLTGQLNLGYLHTRPEGPVPSGDARTLQAVLSYPVIRSFTDNLALSLGADALDSQNALFGRIVTDERVRALRLSLSYVRGWRHGDLALAGTISLGLDGFGARAAARAESDFTKLNLQGALRYALSSDWTLRLRGVAQFTPDRLPASEFIALGGGEFGRYFSAASITGDRGMAGSLELAYGLGTTGWDRLQGAELYGFADSGSSTLSKRPPLRFHDFSLTTAGLGLRLPFGENLALFLEAAKPVNVPLPGFSRGVQFGFGLSARY